METTEQKFKRMYANQVRILNLEHMRKFPVIGYCRIEMVGDDALKACIGNDLYYLLADALTRLRELDAEINRRRLYLRLITLLSKMNLGELEGECINIIRTPRSKAPKVSKPIKRYDSLLRV